MREKKFRGQTFDGKWVFGDLLQENGTDAWIAAHYTVLDDFIQAHAVAVDPETVGEYTGLKDKNGKEIYEGDIVLITYGKWAEEKQGLTRIGKVIFSKHAKFCVKINNSAVEVGFYDSKKSDIEVIGNIYENPELLETR